MSALIPKITNQGYEKVVNASGFSASFVRIVLGDKTFEVTGNETELPFEKYREEFRVADNKKEGKNVFHLTADVESVNAYSIYSIGIIARVKNIASNTEEDVLFSIVAQKTPIAVKEANAKILFGLDVELEGINTDNVVFTSGERLNLSFATELAELAKIITEQNIYINKLTEKYTECVVKNANLEARVAELEKKNSAIWR